MSKLDYILRDLGNLSEQVWNFGVVIAGIYALCLLFSAIIK